MRDGDGNLSSGKFMDYGVWCMGMGLEAGDWEAVGRPFYVNEPLRAYTLDACAQRTSRFLRLPQPACGRSYMKPLLSILYFVDLRSQGTLH